VLKSARIARNRNARIEKPGDFDQKHFGRAVSNARPASKHNLQGIIFNMLNIAEVFTVGRVNLLSSCVAGPSVEPFAKILAPTHYALGSLVISEAKKSKTCALIDPDATVFPEPVKEGDAAMTFTPNTFIWE
jgi:hypothetical protein